MFLGEGLVEVIRLAQREAEAPRMILRVKRLQGLQVLRRAQREAEAPRTMLRLRRSKGLRALPRWRVTNQPTSRPRRRGGPQAMAPSKTYLLTRWSPTAAHGPLAAGAASPAPARE